MLHTSRAKYYKVVVGSIFILHFGILKQRDGTIFLIGHSVHLHPF
jgi:hypothetical protein